MVRTQAAGTQVAGTQVAGTQGAAGQPLNEVRLRGRFTGAVERELPSGDVLLQFRVVVDRHPLQRAVGAAPTAPYGRRSCDVER